MFGHRARKQQTRTKIALLACFGLLLSLIGPVVQASAQEGTTTTAIRTVEAATQELAEAEESLTAATTELESTRTARVAAESSLDTVSERSVGLSAEVVVATTSLARTAEAVAAADAEVESAQALLAEADTLVARDADALAAEQTVLGERTAELEAVTAAADVGAAREELSVAVAAGERAAADLATAESVVARAVEAEAEAARLREAAQAAAPSASVISAADALIEERTAQVSAAQLAFDEAVAADAENAEVLLAALNESQAALEAALVERAELANATEAVRETRRAQDIAFSVLEDAEVELAEVAGALEVVNAAIATANAAVREAQLAGALVEAASISVEEAAGVVVAAEGALAISTEAAAGTLRAVEAAVRALTAALDEETTAVTTLARLEAEGTELQGTARALDAEIVASTERIAGLEAEISELLGRIEELASEIAELEAPPEPVVTDQVIEGVVGAELAPLAPSLEGEGLVFAVVEGLLPDGVELGADGSLVGTAAVSGETSVVISVSNAETGESELLTVKFVVEAAETPEPIVIVVVVPEIGETSEALTTSVFQVLPGLSPIVDGNAITVELREGSLPAGIESQADGTFVGRTVVPGVSEAVFRVVDDVTGDIEFRTVTIEVQEIETVIVSAALVVGDTPPSLAPINVANAIETALTSGALPTGLELMVDGGIVGTAAETGVFSLSLIHI